MVLLYDSQTTKINFSTYLLIKKRFILSHDRKLCDVTKVFWSLAYVNIRNKTFIDRFTNLLKCLLPSLCFSNHKTDFFREKKRKRQWRWSLRFTNIYVRVYHIPASISIVFCFLSENLQLFDY